MKNSASLKEGYLVSHRCHERVSALRFLKARKWYAERLRVTAKRHRVPIINYLIAEDGVHLVCAARTPDMISSMMQDLQSSASKKFASKRGGESSMWQGRFKATCIHGGTWIKQCMLLLDLQMIATGKCNHPAEWEVSIPENCKTIDTIPISASPLNDGDGNTVALQTSTKRRRGYLDRIYGQLMLQA